MKHNNVVVVVRTVAVCTTSIVALTLPGCARHAESDPAPVAEAASIPTTHITSSPLNESLYLEAKEIFARSADLRRTYAVFGDYSQFPAELNELLAEPCLGWVKEQYEQGKQDGRHLENPRPLPETTQPLRGISKDGSEVALHTCRDGRGEHIVDAQGNRIAQGTLYYDVMFFKHFDGQLKLFTAITEEVQTCPIR